MCKIEIPLEFLGPCFPVENRSNPYFYRLKRASRNSPPESPESPESPEVVSGSAAQGPPPHAPGARMTVV